MYLRSWLIVPGDSEKKLARASASGADVIIVDLADSVAMPMKQAARERAREWLAVHRTQILENRKFGRWVRVNPLDSRLSHEDLMTVMAGAPDGIVLPRAAGPASIQHLASELYELEQKHGIPTGSTRILPIVSGTARAAIAIPDYVEASLPRLAGLGWEAAGLMTALGATRERHPGGDWTDPMRLVRAHTLLAAHARGEIALETPHPDAEDIKGLKAAAVAGAADGFTGMVALHPAQVPAINAAFTPSDAELDAARVLVSVADGQLAAGIDRRTLDNAQANLARRKLGMQV
ncbi:MAG: CoA ester lyase [Sphingomonadales bacterium]|nr:CoA ester lyase [Sphingomonadales bacterium]